MTLWAVATIMAPNLFLHKAVPSRLTDGGAEKGHAEKAADIMRLLIRYQDLLWTVSGASWAASRGRGGGTIAVFEIIPYHYIGCSPFCSGVLILSGSFHSLYSGQ